MLPNNILTIAGGNENGESTLTPNRLGEMGMELINQGRFRDAKDLFTALLDMQKKWLEEDHQDILTTQFFLAKTLHELGDRAEARRLYRHALEKREAVLGSDHPDML